MLWATMKSRITKDVFCCLPACLALVFEGPDYMGWEIMMHAVLCVGACGLDVREGVTSLCGCLREGKRG
jgi:hypothetical protein